MVRDIVFGARQLRRQPAFAVTAIASLALGIGLTTTLFSIVNGVLFKQAQVASRGTLVELYTGLRSDFPQMTTSYPDYLDIRAGVSAFAGVAGSGYVRGILSADAQPQLVMGEAVTPNYFDVLGIGVARGRGFGSAEETAPLGAPVVVLSHGLWQRRFGGSAAAIGSSIRLSGYEYTIVGVAPAEFTGTIPGFRADFWVPVAMVERFVFGGIQANADNDPGKTRLDRRGTRWLFVKGRLAEGRTIPEARAQVDTVFTRLQSEYPITNDKVTGNIVPASGVRFHPFVDGYVRLAGTALMAAVSVVLLIACANVAGMLLARGAARRREFAIRAALGASRFRIVTQLLSEGLVLAAAGGAGGVLIAIWATGALANLGVGTNVLPVPISFDYTIDRTVLLFALAASIGTALVFGLGPALSSSKLDLVPAIKDTAEGTGRRGGRMREVLVVGQVALSLLLLVTATLLSRGWLAARTTDVGFDPDHIASLSFNLQMNGYDVERATSLRTRALETLRALPGVEAAAIASRVPLASDINVTGVRVDGFHTQPDDEALIDVAAIGDQYFEAVGVPLLSGRGFTLDDVEHRRRVAVVNETMARQFWPGSSPLGRRIFPEGAQSAAFEVVGVARDHNVRSVGEAPRPYLHLPAEPERGIGLVVRTTMPAAAALPMLREAITTLEPSVIFTEDTTAAQIAAATMAPTKVAAYASAAFGGLALLLAAVGLYGAIAYVVSRRTREIGIRMALGAKRGQVLRLVMQQGGRLAAAGIGLGVLASAGAARLLDALLYGVSGIDPVAYASAVAILLLVAGIANMIPALMAARVDPARALRGE
jgi:predicted permease